MAVMFAQLPDKTCFGCYHGGCAFEENHSAYPALDGYESPASSSPASSVDWLGSPASWDEAVGVGLDDWPPCELPA
ncbi:hypothetical protein CDD83_4943 [Cordyceps sp. RAO-2017]|nr:hypothetical protein CDD83_4943 [Cordyceps sp. RAO-2017]